MTVTSGRRCLGLCGSSGPLGCLERTLLESSTWNSNLAVLAWRVKAIRSGRSLFQLAASVPGTGENGVLLWPTPTSRDHKDTGNCENVPVNYLLGRMVKLYPTPNAVTNHNNGRLDEWGGSGNPFRGTPEGRGSLNPAWVEWLMGFPIGWTDCDASVMQLSRNKPIRSLHISHRLRRRTRSNERQT